MKSKSSQKKKILYVSGTRADFGLMTPVLEGIAASPSLDLKLYATGMHLSKTHGATLREVKAKFPTTEVIEASFDSRGADGLALFNEKFFPLIQSVLRKEQPDLVLVLGDRVEMLSTALACLYLNIPVAHIHGGDVTGTVDEVARHAITKLAHIHFAATKQAADRIKRLGEEPWRIHQVGAPGLDAIRLRSVPSRSLVYQFLSLPVGTSYILLIQHPVTDQSQQSGKQMKTIVTALKRCHLPIVAIYPNTDPGNDQIISVLEQEKNNPQFHLFASVEHSMFLGLIREAAVWVGNSSGGIIEAASFHTPVVNVGSRQTGRVRGANVLDVPVAEKAIVKALKKALSDKKFQQVVRAMKNPWGDGQTTPRIVHILEKIAVTSKLLAKKITY